MRRAFPADSGRYGNITVAGVGTRSAIRSPLVINNPSAIAAGGRSHRPDAERGLVAVRRHPPRRGARHGGTTAKLSREQKGRFVALCWIAQIHKHIPDPKPAYTADWDDLPKWQQETDADIFEAVEHHL
ncbi:hypothetical protein ACFWIQ_26710 [Kitasatospora sp. NPDC127059]|uniref:hypothetical protein n=1 Tax=unclassified Kitasatospora TaxID=2633591 RepID=UPI0036617C95